MFKIGMIRSASFMFAAAIVCFVTHDANAQGCGYGGGYGGRYGGGYRGGLSISVGSGYGYGGYGAYGRGISAYRPYYRRPAVWHDTSHYDYRPSQVVPHGNHYDYLPGHYRLHRSGHWDH